MSPDFDLAKADQAFAFGAELGARYAVIAGNDPDRVRLLERLDAVCDLGERYGIRISLEFIFNTEVRTLADARDCLSA